MAEEQDQLLRTLLAYYKKLAESQEQMQKQMGLLTGHVTGAALAVQRLAQTMIWGAVVLVVAFVLAMFVIEYTLQAELQVSADARRSDSFQNRKLREEIWGVITVLVTKQCGPVSGITNSELQQEKEAKQ